jgi:hypothetical protein
LILKSESLISPEIIKVYRETEFRVFVDDVVVLKSAEKSEELVDLFKSYTQMASTDTGLGAVFNEQSKNIRTQCEA